MAMFGRFTEKAQRAILLSQEEAKGLKHNYVGTEHLLLGIIAENTGVGAKALSKSGINIEEAREEIVNLIGEGEYGADILGFTPRTKRIFELGFIEARNLGHNYVGTEHLLLGLLAEGEGVAIVVLNKLGVNIEELKKLVLSMVTSQVSNPSKVEEQANNDTPNLDKYGIDLNKLAEAGGIDPVIGRTKEIERVVQVLSRRTKNNPVLIGEPGVGKTAIAEGLAQKIIEGNIPEIIKDRRVVTLDLPSMIAVQSIGESLKKD